MWASSRREGVEEDDLLTTLQVAGCWGIWYWPRILARRKRRRREIGTQELWRDGGDVDANNSQNHLSPPACCIKLSAAVVNNHRGPPESTPRSSKSPTPRAFTARNAPVALHPAKPLRPNPCSQPQNPANEPATHSRDRLSFMGHILLSWVDVGQRRAGYFAVGLGNTYIMA